MRGSRAFPANNLEPHNNLAFDKVAPPLTRSREDLRRYLLSLLHSDNALILLSRDGCSLPLLLELF
jgi:hypothetical protein